MKKFLLVLLAAFLAWAAIANAETNLKGHQIQSGDYPDAVAVMKDGTIVMRSMLSPEQLQAKKAEDLADYERREAHYGRQTLGVIKRKHQLEVEKAKIEVLGRLQMLTAPQIEVNQNNRTFGGTFENGSITGGNVTGGNITDNDSRNITGGNIGNVTGGNGTGGSGNATNGNNTTTQNN